MSRGVGFEPFMGSQPAPVHHQDLSDLMVDMQGSRFSPPDRPSAPVIDSPDSPNGILNGVFYYILYVLSLTMSSPEILHKFLLLLFIFIVEMQMSQFSFVKSGDFH